MLGVKIQIDVNGAKTDLFEADVLKHLEKTIEIHAITEENDDVQAIPVGQGQPNQTCITAGTSGTLNTISGGDDHVSDNTIDTGANGVCETTATGGDVQAIEKDKGKPDALGVSKGTNNFRDSIPRGLRKSISLKFITRYEEICLYNPSCFCVIYLFLRAKSKTDCAIED